MMPKTEKNLDEAFAGESQANRKYLAFAKKADAEGYGQVAKLFRATAEAETVHAFNHLRELREVKTTRENLEAAIGGEMYEVESMYPPMIQDAVAEGKKGAQISFTYAFEVEKIHAALYKKAVEALGRNEEVEYHVCQVCGNTMEGEPPDQCPICKAMKKMFRTVE
jgi:rubrerythrin